MKSLLLEINSNTLMDHSKTGISHAIYENKEIKLTIPIPNTGAGEGGKVNCTKL